MLLKRTTLDGIADGSITVAYRRWKRPTVVAGGTLTTAIGQLSIEAVDRVPLAGITAADARRAGFDSLAALKAELAARPGGDVYRVRLALGGADPRIALRSAVPAGAELADLTARVRRLGARAATGPWAAATLALIARRPGVRAGDLAAELGRERDAFKVDVRKLKALGLTESLAVGYRLSPRGAAVLRRLD